MSSNKKQKRESRQNKPNMFFLVNRILQLIIGMYLIIKICWGWLLKHNDRIMLILSFITVVFAYQAIQDAKNSSISAELTVNNTAQMVNNTAEMVNKTTEMVKWYYEPQPQMNIWTSVDYESSIESYNDGFVYVDKWTDYAYGKGFNILSDGRMVSGYFGYCGDLTKLYQAPSYLACCKNIKIYVYNSGRGSIIFPLITFDLETKDKAKGVIFKVHTVKTRIDKLEYHPQQKCMFESQEFVENESIEMPYRAVNNDFPPYLDGNNNSYFVPPSFSKELMPYVPFVNPWNERNDVLGPFRIGTISPGEAAEIELKIFSTEDECNEGTLNISVKSLNTGIGNRVINLKTGRRDTCKNREESEKYIKSRYP